MGQEFEMGDRVRVTHKHWRRGGHIGTIVAFDIEKQACRWTVAFDIAFPGGGFTEEVNREWKQCLNMDASQLEKI